MKHNITILLLLLVMTSISCKKKDDPCPEPNFPQDFLDYWYFPAGSYWVYQDTASMEIDTVVVDRNGIESIQDDACLNSSWLYLKHSKNVPDLFFNEDFFNSLDDEGSTNILIMTFNGSNFLDYPIALGEQKLMQSEVLDTNNVITALDTFYNCVHVRSDSFFEITFSQGIGIVTRKYTDGTFWELIDYEIK